jgi:hypothetical protein
MMEADAVAPHDLAAERAVLGAVLVSNAQLAPGSAVVLPSDFFRDAHVRIFGAMLKLAGRNAPIDLLTLKAELAGSGELEEIGGPAYIASLVDGVPRSANIEHYARIVRTAALARTINSYAKQAIETFSKNPEALGNGAGTRFAEAVRRAVDDAHGGGAGAGLPADDLDDAVDVTRQGRQIAEEGIRYRVHGVIPDYGTVGFKSA